MSSLPSPYSLEAIDVTPDDKFIIGGGGNWRDHPGRILVWDLQTGQLKREDKWSHFELHDILVMPDSQTIVISGRDDHTFLDGHHYIYTGSIENGKYALLFEWEFGSLKLGFTLDKKYLQFDKYFWDWKMGGNILNQDFQMVDLSTMRASVDVAEREQEELVKGRYNRIKLNEDIVLYANEKTFTLEEVSSKKTVLTFDPGHEDRYYQFMPMAVTPDLKYLIAPKVSYKPKQSINLGKWDIQTGRLVEEFEVCSQGNKIMDIAITGDSQKAVILAYDPETVIRIIELNTGICTMEIIPPQIQ